MTSNRDNLCYSLVADLWCKIILEDSELVNFELGNEWLLLMQSEAGECWKVGSLVEQVEVVQSELLGDALLNFDGGLILLSVTIVGGKLDETGSSLSFNEELNVIWLGDNGQGVWKSLELFAYFWELTRVDSDEGAILGLWDAKVFDLQGNQVESEFGSSLWFWVLENDLKGACILIGLESDGVSCISEFQDLGEVENVDTKDDIVVASEFFESLRTEIEGNQSNMRGIHGLERKTYIENIRIRLICCVLTRWSNIDVDVSDKILDGFNDFLKNVTFSEFCFEHV